MSKAMSRLPQVTNVHRKSYFSDLSDAEGELLADLLLAPKASAVPVDSQSVKTTEKKGEVYGFDGGKKVKECKRHVLVESHRLVIGLPITEANAPERLVAASLVDKYKQRLTHLRMIWVD